MHVCPCFARLCLWTYVLNHPTESVELVKDSPSYPVPEHRLTPSIGLLKESRTF
jgi:hypothetical protein